MKANLSKKDIIELTKQIDMEPSEQLVTKIDEEINNNSKEFYDSRKTKLSVKMFALIPIAICMIVVGIFVIKDFTAFADEEYSYKEFNMNTSVEGSDEFFENMHNANFMGNSIFKNLPYNGKYKAAASTGSYTVNGLSASDFPDYYAGIYINIDGKLIVQIKKKYYEKNYRETDWYRELVSMMGSEDFACHPVEFNFTEIVNGMSDIYEGELYDSLTEKGINIKSAGINDYKNKIEVAVGTKELAKKAKKLLNKKMYEVIVEEGGIVG